MPINYLFYLGTGRVMVTEKKPAQLSNYLHLGSVVIKLTISSRCRVNDSTSPDGPGLG